MKAVLLVFIFLLSGCKSSQNEPEELGFGAEKEKRFIEFDCPDVMASYEDTYLNKVKDLDGYSWNQSNNTATIKISEIKTLKSIFLDANQFLGLVFLVNQRIMICEKTKIKLFKICCGYLN